MRARNQALPVWLVCLLVSAHAAGCGAVYPELSAPEWPVPEGRELSPPPPDDMLYVAFEKAEIPERTRDGRRWDSTGGEAPDPFAKIRIGDEELLRTPVQNNTLTPTWPDAVRGNHRIAKGAVLEVELWDANPLSNHPICVKRLRRIHEQAGAEGITIVCESGARIRLAVEPARPRFGLGFHYELRTKDVVVTRVVPESPAGRAGMRPGDELLKIQGKDVTRMKEGEPRSLITTHARTGLQLSVKHTNGSTGELKLQAGPIYALPNDASPR